MKKTAQQKPNLDKKTKTSLLEVDDKELKLVAGGRGVIAGGPQGSSYFG